MNLLLALCFLGSQNDPTDAPRASMIASIKSPDTQAALRAAAALVKANHERSASALASALPTGFAVLSDFDGDRKKWKREMERHAPEYDKKTGRVVKPGDVGKWAEAKSQMEALEGKIDALQHLLPRLAAQIAKLSSPDAAKGMLQVLKSEGHWLPRAWCAETLGKLDDPALLQALLAHAKVEGSAAVRVGIAEGLGPRIKDSEEALKLLTSWTENPYWQVRLAAVQALARASSPTSVSPLINLLLKEQGRMRNEVNEALKKITGVDKHGEHAAWKEWWDQNRDEVLAGTYSARATERPNPAGLSTFYGIQVVSTRLSFLIDCSTSMLDVSTWTPDVVDGPDRLEGNRAVDVAKYELKKIIRRLPEGARYEIHSIAGPSVDGPNERDGKYAGGSREGAVQWIQKLQLRKDGTDILAAFTRAFDATGGAWNAPLSESSVDTFFVLSDGAPSTGVKDREQIAERVFDALHFRKVAIYSIAVDAPSYGADLLTKLAERSGGKFEKR